MGDIDMNHDDREKLLDLLTRLLESTKVGAAINDVLAEMGVTFLRKEHVSPHTLREALRDRRQIALDTHNEVEAAYRVILEDAGIDGETLADSLRRLLDQYTSEAHETEKLRRQLHHKEQHHRREAFRTYYAGALASGDKSHARTLAEKGLETEIELFGEFTTPRMRGEVPSGL
jgi:hypothetical protein